MRIKSILIATSAVVAMMVAAHDGAASSHREAPFLTKNPKVDGTDFYLFNSYEAGRTGFVTAIANYQPLQDPIGGPNYFTMDPEAIYEIHFDNDADAKEDLTFQFQFQNKLAGGTGIELPIGDLDAGTQKNVAIPLAIAGPINGNDAVMGAGAETNINVLETYTMKVIRGNRRTGTVEDVTHDGGNKVFTKPIDNIGSKAFPGTYAAYANQFKKDITIPGCGTPGKVFVGQRAESFAVNLGTIFDLVDAPLSVIADNTNRGAVSNPIGGKNVTSIAIELPVDCVRKGATGTDTIIGGWTTASIRQARAINPNATYTTPAREGGAWAQVSRLGAPLVNEVVIGLRDKDRWNSSEPSGDAQFIDYVTNPTLAKLIEVIVGSANAPAPTAIPRNDLVAAFLKGVTGVNANGSTAEYLRLNTALPATAAGSQNPLGALGCFTAASGATAPVVDTNLAACDVAGFPNGRRPKDDTVDIALRVMMGRLLAETDAPASNVPLHDAVAQESTLFDATFPYLKTPAGGS
jgi:hypothetical protein